MNNEINKIIKVFGDMTKQDQKEEMIELMKWVIKSMYINIEVNVEEINNDLLLICIKFCSINFTIKLYQNASILKLEYLKNNLFVDMMIIILKEIDYNIWDIFEYNDYNTRKSAMNKSVLNSLQFYKHIHTFVLNSLILYTQENENYKRHEEIYIENNGNVLDA